MIRTKFWGVRGSIPATGHATADIGGNTSCVEVRCGDSLLIFDGGTGLRLLGRSLAPELPTTVHLFFSHVHWDHIQGFPFFAPAFSAGNTIHMYGARNFLGTVETAMAGQMEFPNFPVVLGQLASELKFHDITPGETIEVADDVKVRTVAGNHPGGVLIYRVEHAGSAVVYATDTEYEDEIDEAVVDLCRGADVLIFDSMYTPEEYEGKADGTSRKGWGHSTMVTGARLANLAGVGQYVLFHHDPDQDDEAVAAKTERAKALFENSIAAYEGLTIEVG